MFRQATINDMAAIEAVYAAARRFMAENGNPHQWGTTNPPRERIERLVSIGELYVEETDGEVHAAFSLTFGDDPTYGVIDDGDWLSDAPYAAIHNVASDGAVAGFFTRCVAFCRERSDHLRIDTHADNKVMQHLVTKHGFSRRGIIYLANGSPRIVYEWMK